MNRRIALTGFAGALAMLLLSWGGGRALAQGPDKLNGTGEVLSWVGYALWPFNVRGLIPILPFQVNEYPTNSKIPMEIWLKDGRRIYSTVQDCSWPVPASKQPPTSGQDYPSSFPIRRTQVRFVRPARMRVALLEAAAPGGQPCYSENPLEVPGRHNFLQGAIYHLKFTNIPDQPGLELFPTLEVVPAKSRTEAFLTHNCAPVEFTPKDFRQMAAGKSLVKVIYLPRVQGKDGPLPTPSAISSTKLPPDADPITEALRRGDILLVVRMSNSDQNAPNMPSPDSLGSFVPHRKVGLEPWMPASPDDLRGFRDLVEGARGTLDCAASRLGLLPFFRSLGIPINGYSYSSDPNVRMEQLLFQHSSSGQISREWLQDRKTQQPSPRTYEPIHGGIGP
jgi:hypothetical protein